MTPWIQTSVTGRTELLFVEMGRAIWGDYQEFRFGWARFEMLIGHASVMKGDFTTVHWQGYWIGENDRDGDTLYQEIKAQVL